MNNHMIIMNNFTVSNGDINGLAISFATDETGADWYESQKNFQAYTLKIVFNNDGIIVSMSHDVSALWPGGSSVAEIALKDVPKGLSINGDWLFNGERIIPRTPTVAEWQTKAETQRQNLLKEADGVITDWRTELQLGTISEEDKDCLIEWMTYIKSLKTLDLTEVKDEATLNKVTWPDKPNL